MYPPYDMSLQQSQDLIRSMLTPQQTLQTQKHITKVNGRAGAELYNLPPNSDDLLLDMNESIVWFVKTDGAGLKTVIPYDISVHKEIKQEDHIKAMEERITRLEEAINNGKSNITTVVPKSKSGAIRNDASNRSNDER